MGQDVELTRGKACEVAQMLGQKLCRKMQLPQLLISFNVQEDFAALLLGDFKLMGNVFD